MDPQGARPADRRTRAVAWAAVVLVVAVVGVVPLVQDRDSFPLSTYPMFSSRRTTTEPVDTAVGVTAAGDVLRLNPRLVSGSREVVFSAMTVTAAVRGGPDAVGALCREIAARVAEDGPADAVSVEIVTELHDSVRWFQGDHTDLERTVHGSCPVER